MRVACSYTNISKQSTRDSAAGMTSHTKHTTTTINRDQRNNQKKKRQVKDALSVKIRMHHSCNSQNRSKQITIE
jgi:hypothetical protein